MAIFGTKSGVKQVGKPDGRSGPISSNNPGLLRLGWLGLKVADVVNESRFLENTLKLRFLDESNSPDGHHVHYNSGSLTLELVSGGATWATRSRPRHGQPDISLVPNLHYNDLNYFAAGLKDQEVPHTRLFEQGWGASLFFLDPERNIWQANEIRVEPALAAENIPHIAALWLSVEDFPAQLNFYRDVLGLKLVNQGDYSPPITEASEHYQQQNPVILPATPRPASPTVPSISTGAVFSAGEVKLALSPGGQRLEEGKERVWGIDTAFLPGFQTNNLTGFAKKLSDAGIKTSGPYPFYYVYTTATGPRWQAGSALRFFDLEGHPLQVYQ